MPRVAYPSEVGIRDADIIEVRISTAMKRGKSTRKMPTDHILKVKHRIFGWLSPWEWGILAKLEKGIDKILELMNSFLRTEVGVIIFTLGGSLSLLYMFGGEKITGFILSMIYRAGDLAKNALQSIKDFLTSIFPQVPGFPDIPPLELPDLPSEPEDWIQPGHEEKGLTANFIDAVFALFNRLINDPLFGIGGQGPFIPGSGPIPTSP